MDVTPSNLMQNYIDIPYQDVDNLNLKVGLVPRGDEQMTPKVTFECNRRSLREMKEDQETPVPFRGST